MKNGSARDEVLLCGEHRCSVHNCKIICKRVSEITSFLLTDSIPTTEKGISHDYKRQCFNSSICTLGECIMQFNYQFKGKNVIVENHGESLECDEKLKKYLI